MRACVGKGGGAKGGAAAVWVLVVAGIVVGGASLLAWKAKGISSAVLTMGVLWSAYVCVCVCEFGCDYVSKGWAWRLDRKMCGLPEKGEQIYGLL